MIFLSINSACVNYEDPNYNIGLPVFSIHGNHDDPTGVCFTIRLSRKEKKQKQNQNKTKTKEKNADQVLAFAKKKDISIIFL